MEIQFSEFLKKSKPYLKELINELDKDFKYVSVLATDSKGKEYLVSNSEIHIDKVMVAERGFVVRVYNGINYSEYSFNYIDDKNVGKIVLDIKNKFKNFSDKIENDLELIEYDVIKEEAINKKEQKPVEISPQSLGDEKIIKRLTEINNKGMSLSDKIVQFKSIYQYAQINKIFLSKKKDLEESYMWSNGMLICMTSEGENTKVIYDSFSGLKGAELLDEIENGVEILVENGLALLKSEPIKPGEYDVICSPAISGLIAHEAFGHGVEMDMFLKDRAKSKYYMNKEIASELVTMHDGALGVNETASYVFDDEGNLANDTIIIDKGIFKRGLCDTLSASKLNVIPANGRRESYERKAYSRMTNTYFEAGKDKLQDMIKSIDYGFLIEGSGSGMEDPKNWGIQCIAIMAKEIKHGELTGKIYSPVIMTGYVPDLLKSISMVSENVSLEGAGFCGKGSKEWVKVSCGGPYIKTKVRLG